VSHVHLPTRHETRENTKSVASALSIQNLVEISMGKDDAPAVKA
jgi:hypothetical protein